MTEDRSPRIVVGVDGSEGSKAALRWAVEEARVRRGSVEVVHAWDFPAIALAHYGEAVLPLFNREDLEKAAENLVRETLIEVLDGDVQVPVNVNVVMGHPASVLLAEAADAALVVVGARGHGGFGSLLLGSVSSQVAHHAEVPVVIVPMDRAAAA